MALLYCLARGRVGVGTARAYSPRKDTPCASAQEVPSAIVEFAFVPAKPVGAPPPLPRIEPLPAKPRHEGRCVIADGKAMHDVADVLKRHGMAAHAAGQSLAKLVML